MADPLRFEHAMLFFDLAGTLIETGASLSLDRRRILLATARQAARMVLVTGQDSSDPQVKELLSVFRPEVDVDFVVYATRGGLRLRRTGEDFEADGSYLEETRLDEMTCSAVIGGIESLLATRNQRPLIPEAVIDGVAVRVNLPPAERPAFAAALRLSLERLGLPALQVVIEGHTSIFVMRWGVDKRKAVAYELKQLTPKGDRPIPAYYFGNEFEQGGNDRDVFGLPLTIFALGSCGQIPADVQCRSIGSGPEDLYRFLARAGSPP
jgi:hypothetical protein